MVVMGNDAEAVCIYGPLPWRYPQESGAAETFAAIETIQASLPPIRLLTDCKLLVDGVAAGKA